MGSLLAVLSEPELRALSTALEAYPDAVEDEPGTEPRSRVAKMADCLLDLILRAGKPTGHRCR